MRQFVNGLPVCRGASILAAQISAPEQLQHYGRRAAHVMGPPGNDAQTRAAE